MVLAEEEKRIHARRKRVKTVLEWLKRYVMDVMRNRGINALKTSLNTIHIQGNGGLRELLIDDSEAVPDELCQFEGSLNMHDWDFTLAVLDALPQTDLARRSVAALRAFSKKPIKELVRAALEKKCEVCSGAGTSDPQDPEFFCCGACGGSGYRQVSGAHLADRGESLRIS